MSLVHVPAGVAWGLVPAWSKVDGAVLYEKDDTKQNYVISVSAPYFGILAPDPLSKFTEYCFMLATGCGLTVRVPKKNPCSAHLLARGDLVKMACAMLKNLEAEERPCQAQRKQKEEQARIEQEKKRKQNQYCENCQCESCKKRRKV